MKPGKHVAKSYPNWLRSHHNSMCSNILCFFTMVYSFFISWKMSTTFMVTRSEVHCSNCHPVHRHEISRSSCDILIVLCPGLILQDHLDGLTVPLSTSCPDCSMQLYHRFTFVFPPPLIVFDLRQNLCTLPDCMLMLSCTALQHQYTLQELLFCRSFHLLHNYCIRDGLVPWWAVDREFLSVRSLSTLETAFGIFSCCCLCTSSLTLRNSDMPCTAMAH